MQAGRLGGDVDLGTELARLDQRAVGELGAGDPGGKAEVILDLRRGRGAPSGRDRVEQDRLQALGGGVDGGRETGRAGADDQQVAVAGAVRERPQADHSAELGCCRIAQHLLATPDHDRCLVRRHPELAQQRLGLGVLLEVDPRVRYAVARGELAQASRVRRIARADDAQPGALANQQRAPQKAGPDQQVAERRIVVDELAQLVERDREDLARLAHPRGRERRLSGEQVELAEETPRPVDPDHPLLVVDLLDHRDQPGEDHEQRRNRLSLLVEHLALGRDAALTARPHLVDLLLAQARVGTEEVEGLLRSRRIGRAHGAPRR